MHSPFSALRPDSLTAFLAVVDEGSFIAAADRLGHPQSRVSQHVAALETTTGTQLFDRTRRPVEVTDAGQAMAAQARLILDTLDTAARTMDTWRTGTEQRPVRLGVHPGASAVVLPLLLRHLAEEHPDVDVTVTELATPAMDAALERSELDLCLRPMEPPPAVRSLACHALWEEPVMVVYPPEHPLASLPEPVPIGAVSAHPVVVLSGVEPSDAAMHPTQLQARRLVPVQMTDQPHTLLALAAAGLAVGIAPLLATQGTHSDALTVRRLGTRAQHGVGLYWRQGRPFTPAVRQVHTALMSITPPNTVTPSRAIRKPAEYQNY
ncbi:LysR family transcriptional regulator [Nocardiopsis flavescens]|uniref:LysR family transcriptional regulator n=1 Tax=Nocardiopsis flavescens TaxID=758803 RepID=UPI00364BF937